MGVSIIEGAKGMWDTSKTKRGLEASFFSYGAEGGTRLYPKGEPTGTARACGT